MTSAAAAFVVSRDAALLVVVALVVAVLELFLPPFPGVQYVSLAILAAGLLIAAVVMWDAAGAVRKRLGGALFSAPDQPRDADGAETKE